MDADMINGYAIYREVVNAPVTLPLWALEALCIQHVRAVSETDCDGCEACDHVRLAAHEAFFLLSVEMRSKLCSVCFETGLDPLTVFGWEPEDFLALAE